MTWNSGTSAFDASFPCCLETSPVFHQISNAAGQRANVLTKTGDGLATCRSWRGENASLRLGGARRTRDITVCPPVKIQKKLQNMKMAVNMFRCM